MAPAPTTTKRMRCTLPRLMPSWRGGVVEPGRTRCCTRRCRRGRPAPARRRFGPGGRPYSADYLVFVWFMHVAEMAIFLAPAQRYASRPLTPEECDRYYE